MLRRKELSRSEILESKRYKILLASRYFEKGRSKLFYIQYVIGLYALASQDVINSFLVALVFGISCLALGYWWYWSDTIAIEYELGNQFNLFVKEVRKVFK